MRQWKTSLWHDALLKTHGDCHKFWKLVRTRVTKRRSVLLQSNDSVMDTYDQAEALATFMSTDSQSRVAVPGEAPRMTHERNFMFVSPKQLTAILKRTKGGKSPGHDKIQYVLIRQLPRRSLSYLTHLLNSCLRLRHFPSSWKHALIAPLLKPTKNGTSPEHYRPISLLPHISKILEKIIHKYLMNFCEDHNLIPDEQAGFRQFHSTELPLVRIQSHASLNLRKNTPTALISIDCTKAFESVDHNILLSLLRSHDCPEQLYNILASFLSNRTFQMKVGTSLSSTFPIPSGVPQGSVLAPTLFSIYTGHIVGRHYPNAHISAYADDIAIFSSSINPTLALKQAESTCQDISSRLRAINIHVNPSKTDALIFAFRKYRPLKIPKTFKIDGTYQPLSHSITYLGIHFDRHLRFSTHVSRKIKSAQRTYHSLKHLLFSPNLSLRLKLLIYKGVIRPSLLYGSPILRYLTKTSLTKLQSYQNKILQKITIHSHLHRKHTSLIHDTLNLPTITQYLKKRHIKFFDSLQYCPNPLFSSISPPPQPNDWKNSTFKLVDILHQS